MVSPTRIGRSKSRISPETKLFTMLYRPKPIPTPNAPAMMVTFVRSSPRIARPARKPSARRM